MGLLDSALRRVEVSDLSGLRERIALGVLSRFTFTTTSSAGSLLNVAVPTAIAGITSTISAQVHPGTAVAASGAILETQQTYYAGYRRNLTIT